MCYASVDGFVVIAPAMTDNWGMLFESVYQSEITRPRDASRTLDFAERLTASNGQLAGLIDLNYDSYPWLDAYMISSLLRRTQVHRPCLGCRCAGSVPIA